MSVCIQARLSEYYVAYLILDRMPKKCNENYMLMYGKRLRTSSTKRRYRLYMPMGAVCAKGGNFLCHIDISDPSAPWRTISKTPYIYFRARKKAVTLKCFLPISARN